MNVLSLFDGISCGQVALQRAGIKVDKYFASEIDKYAIKTTQKNFPDTAQLGDVQFVNGDSLPKVDLLLAGSPCQGFSIAGKQLNFSDQRSTLFFEFVRVLEETKPKYFLLENVRMKQEFQNVISALLGVNPVLINSADFSAQDRKRLYWTNIDIPPISAKSDAVVEDVLKPLAYSNIVQAKQVIRNSRYRTNRRLIAYIKSNSQGNRIYTTKGKSICLCGEAGGRGPKTGLYSDETLDVIRKLSAEEAEHLQTLPMGYTEGISKTQRLRALGNGWTVDVITHILKGIIINAD